MPKWIEFRELAPVPKLKTKRWGVVATQRMELLGEIEWYTGWRQYVFVPNPNTIYERQCLHDIATFCESQTKAQRASKGGASKGGSSSPLLDENVLIEQGTARSTP